MPKILIGYLTCAIVVLSAKAFAGPNIPSDYKRLATCNDDAIQFFQTVNNGTASDNGLLITIGKDKLFNLELVTNIRGSDKDGYSLNVNSESTTPVNINADGTGAWSHLDCIQDANGTHCQNVTESLICKFPSPIPSGFSAGH